MTPGILVDEGLNEAKQEKEKGSRCGARELDVLCGTSFRKICTTRNRKDSDNSNGICS